jgi:hypothetical protein
MTGIQTGGTGGTRGISSKKHQLRIPRNVILEKEKPKDMKAPRCSRNSCLGAEM